jgi:hypothetical protein
MSDQRIWIVYCPDEGFERHETREAAEIAAHKALDYFCGDGWPEDIEDLAVYEARPVLAAREVAGSRREIVDCRVLNCVGGEIEHPDGSVSECLACEGTGRVYDDGEAAHVDSDWDHVVNFELVEEKPPPVVSVAGLAPGQVTDIEARCADLEGELAEMTNERNELLARVASLEVAVENSRPGARGAIPAEPGYYWAKWRIASDGTVEGDELTPSDTWEIVQVNLNAPYAAHDDPERLSVSVPGVQKGQWLDCFVWGGRVAPLQRELVSGDQR